jgi:hypothetical protein
MDLLPNWGKRVGKVLLKRGAQKKQWLWWGGVTCVAEEPYSWQKVFPVQSKYVHGRGQVLLDGFVEDLHLCATVVLSWSCF